MKSIYKVYIYNNKGDKSYANLSEPGEEESKESTRKAIATRKAKTYSRFIKGERSFIEKNGVDIESIEFTTRNMNAEYIIEKL